MRLISNNNEQKIVTTDDIIVSSDKSSATVLTDVIDQLSQDNTENKSNIKWLAAHRGYGNGTGGSGGGGGGTSLVPELLLYVNDMTTNITKETTDIVLDGQNTYPIKIKVNRSQGHAFSIILKVDNSTTKINLPVDNSYEYTTNKFLQSNGTISVTATDLSTGDDLETLTFPYLTESQHYNFILKNNSTGDTKAAESQEILSENAHDYSILIDYKCALSGVSATYTEINSYKSTNNQQLTTGELDYNNKIEGTQEIDNLFPNDSSLFGQYTVGFNVVQTWKGKSINFSKSIIFTIIPPSYFEQYSLESGTVFATLDEAKHATSSDLVPQGYLPIMFKWYIGQQTDGYRTYQAKVERLNKNNDYVQSGTGFNNASINIRTSTNLSNYGLNIVYDTTSKDVQTFSFTEDNVIYTYQILRLTIINSDSSTPSYRYLAIKEPTKSYTWPANKDKSYGIDTLAKTYYYRSGNNISDKEHLPVPAQDITVETLSPDENTNQISVNICLGIQYSKYSKENSVIARISNGSKDIITFTQSQVLINGQKISYYLPTQENLNKFSTNPEDWALIDLNIQYVKTVGPNAYVDISLYVNGDLCGEFQSLQTFERGDWKYLYITKDWIGYVNLYDISFYSTKLKEDDSTSTTYTPWDLGAVMYYNKYIKTLNENNVSNDTITLLNSVLAPSKLLTDTAIGLQYLSSNGDFKEISKSLPVVLLQISASGEEKASEWLKNKWLKPYTDERAEVQGHDAKLYYYLNGTDPSYRDDLNFSIQVQGSSSKLYRSKNIQLTIKNDESSNNKILFTPNYTSATEDMTPEAKELAYQTFLPEESFVLKADVVDSSMCNNNAIGNFVNKYTTKFKTVVDPKSELAPYVKNCLLGFPVLVVFEVEEKYYIMGIYNFNLGRDSYANLGYYTKEYYTNAYAALEKNSSGGFQYISIPTPLISEDLYMAEVSNGDHWFDFSQYDKNLLTNPKMGMFSHITQAAGKDNSDKLVKFVKQVSRGGGYIFDTMKKNRLDLGNLQATAFPYREGILDPQSKLYISGNYVSDYTKQYTLSANNQYVLNTTTKEATSDDLTTLISEGTAENPNTPMLDYRSVCEYYTIVMIFGMVDSVMKNLELKTWTASNYTPTFYVAFYDMDTANGKNNAGGKTNYVAFSDYWQSVVTDKQLKGIKVYRDYWPNFSDSTAAESGYDIPITYLLAIGKYAQLKWKNNSTNKEQSLAEGSLYLPSLIYGNHEYEFSPTTLYASYRRKGGPLENAKSYVKNFYKSRLAKVPQALININYRNKYFNLQVWDRNNTEAKDYGADSVRNSGNELAYIEDWMNSRLKMLDSYFFVNPNIPQNIQYCTISKTVDGSTNYNWDNNGQLNVVTDNYGNVLCLDSLNDDLLKDVQDNKDVDILQSILGPTPLKMEFSSANYSINITAPKDSISLIQYSDSNFASVIQPDAQNEYTISVGAAGNNSVNYYGSNVWKTISNVGSMLGTLTSGTYSIASNYLTKIYGQSNNSMNGLNLDCPNVTSIQLNNNSVSKTYTGDLKISNATVGLTSLNISNTKFDIRPLNDGYNDFSLMPKLTTVTLDGCDSSNINLSAASYITSLSLNNSVITTFICKAWKNDITLNEIYQKFTDLTILGKDGTNSLTITGTNNKQTSALTTLTVSNVNTVTIQNCPKLNSVILSNVKTLRIINCYTDDLSVFSNGNVRKSKTITLPKTCESIKFYGTTGFDVVNLELGRTVPVNCEDNCFRETKVKEITDQYTTTQNNPNYLYYVGNAAFNAVTTLPIVQQTGNTVTPLPIRWGSIQNGQVVNRDANNAFESFTPTNNTNTNANWISLLSSMKGTYVTSAAQMFRLCPIPAKTYNESVNLGNALQLTNISNANEIFMYTKIKWYTKELMNFPKITSMYKCTQYSQDSPDDAYMCFTLNFLENCGGNVISYSEGADNTQGLPIEWYNSDGSVIYNTRVTDSHRRIKAQDVLKYLPKIQSLEQIFINTSQYVDLLNAFSNNGSLTNIKGFIWQDTYAYNYTWHTTDSKGNTTYSSIFSGLDKINSIQYFGDCNIAPREQGYQQGDIYTDGDYIDYIHLFTTNQWNGIKNHSISFNQSLNYKYRNKTFCMYKYITLNDFTTIFTYLSGQTQWYGFFNNCIITDANSDLILFQSPITTSTLHNVNSFYKAFMNFKVANIAEGKQYALILSKDFISYLPNCTVFQDAFNSTIQKTVFPYNFWNNRDPITDSSIGYIPETRITETTVTDSTGKTTVNKVKTTVQVPVQGKYYTYRASNVDNIIGMFSNVYWDVNHIFDPFSNLPNGLSVTGNSYKEKYDSLQQLAKDYSTLKKRKTNNNGQYLNAYGQIIDDSDINNRVWEEINTNVYYVNGNKKTFRPATEFSDVLTPVFQDSGQARNYGLYQNVTIELSDKSGSITLPINQYKIPNEVFPILPTDFFYNLSLQGISVDNVFSGNPISNTFTYVKSNMELKTITYTATSNSGGYLMGYLPQHLYANSGVTEIQNTVANQIVLPVKQADITNNTTTIHIYSFVPKGFVSATITSLNNAFNFQILLPDYIDANQYDRFFIFRKDSFVNRNNIASMSYGLPNYIPYTSRTNTINGRNFASTKVDTNYYLMGDPNNKYSICTFSEFNNLDCYNLITGRLTEILEGNLFNDTINVSQIRLTASNGYLFNNFQNHDGSYQVINANLILPKLDIAATNKNILPEGHYNNLCINVSTVRNDTNWNNFNYTQGISKIS